MADEDEIDILGDFSFNSCFAQNNQGIPSCSNREDTIHPQWLLDSTATNWYDTQNRDRIRLKDGPYRKLSGNNANKTNRNEIQTTWSQRERDVLGKEMEKYGRNVSKIAQTLKTKTEAEIRALIEAEHGVYLDPPDLGLVKHDDYDNVPAVVQEEIVMDDVLNIKNTLNKVTTASPTVPSTNKDYFRKKCHNILSKKSLLKPLKSNHNNEADLVKIDTSEIFYEDDLNVGSTEFIGSDLDATDFVSKNLAKQQKEKIKSIKKVGNHRRKISRNYDRGKVRISSKEILKSPQGRQRLDSGVSEDNCKSPKMQIVLGSGQALPVSEGEQIIKIEKRKDSEPESDIEIDIDSDKEDTAQGIAIKQNNETLKHVKGEAPITVPFRKFEPMPKRGKKINLNGGGGCTIMHTDAGDLYEVATEPRRERPPKNPPIHLIQCRFYNTENPAPCEVSLNVSALIAMDAHAHTSRGEVMGLVGGEVMRGGVTNTSNTRDLRLLLAAYCRAAAASARTHCDMDPVSQCLAAERLRGRGLRVCAWHHSHPAFPAAPSLQDLRSQRSLQAAFERTAPFLALLTSQQWPRARRASQYRCFHVDDADINSDIPTGYQLSVKLVPDLSESNLEKFVSELRGLLLEDADRNDLIVDMPNDVCPQAGMTYLEKLISSVSHHMQSAGYAEDDPIKRRLLQGIRDVFR